MINYSIIIPHYNIPDLLKRCLVSIPQREDVQVIVVDDHSSQESQTELKELEAQFPTFQFVYSERNGGGGVARNIGLQHARGKYVLFSDADDFFHECLNDVLDDYKDETCDIVFFNADSVDCDTLEPCKPDRAEKLQGQIAGYAEGRKGAELTLRYLFPEPWCKMIRREMIERVPIRFDATFVMNDYTFSYLAGYHAKTVRADVRKLYCVTYRQSSVWYSGRDTIERVIAVTEGRARKNRFMKDHHIPVFDEQMTWPFGKALRQRDWTMLNALFDVVGRYGYSRVYVLYRLLMRFVRYRLGNYKRLL